jgi:hypothetical protein
MCKILIAILLMFSSFCGSAIAQGPGEVVNDLVPPSIDRVMFDGKTFFPGDIISSTPRISAVITDDRDIISTVEVRISGVLAYSGSPGIAYNAVSRSYDYQLADPQKLEPGTYEVEIRVWDESGNRCVKKFSRLNVIAGLPDLKGPSCYPRNFRPGGGADLDITYYLSFDSPATVYIYNGSSGELKWSKYVEAGLEGGRAGLNRISWDGYDSNGSVTTNGYYGLKIVAGNRILGEANFLVVE